MSKRKEEITSTEVHYLRDLFSEGYEERINKWYEKYIPLENIKTKEQKLTGAK